MTAAQTHAAFHVPHIIAAGLLSLLAFAGYANALANGFVWDDTYQILQNPFIRPGASWLRLFTSGVWAFSRQLGGLNNDYRPLQTLTYKATAQLFGFSAPAFHAVSLLFHLLTTLLVYAVAWRLLRRVVPAAAAAVLFALHPMHTEAVAWASALPDLGCALFYLLAFWLFLLAEDPAALRPRRLRLWASSYCSFFIALLWKEMALTLPLLVAVHCLLFSPKESPWRVRVRRGLRAAIPYGAAFAVYLPLRWHALGHLYLAQRHWQLAPAAYAATVLNLLVQYVWALLWPVGLNAYHVFDPVRSLADPRLYAGVLLAALVAAGIGYAWRRSALAAFAVLWILLTLIPVLNLGALGRNVFAERYLYLPSVGFCLLAVWLADKALSRLAASRRAPVGACTLILVTALYGAQTARRNPDWRDPYTFFSTAAAASPNSPDMQNGLAAVLRFDRGDLIGAENHYLRARTLAGQRRPPEWDQAEAADLGLGLIAGERGDFHQALDWLDLARAADPDDPQLPSARAGILLHAGRWQEAETEFQAVLQHDPDDANAWNGLGYVAWQYEHRDDRAEADFTRALRSLPLPEPLRASLEASLGAVQCEQGRCQEGVAHLQAAADLNPNDPEIRTNLARSLQAAGRRSEARTQLLRALALAPNYTPARAALAAMDGQ